MQVYYYAPNWTLENVKPGLYHMYLRFGASNDGWFNVSGNTVVNITVTDAEGKSTEFKDNRVFNDEVLSAIN